MSLILEALNRARREQQNAAPVPGVDSIHFEAEPQQHRQRWAWFLLAAGGVLVVGILLGGYVTRFAGPAVQFPVQPATPLLPPPSASTEVAPTAQATAPPVAVEAIAPVMPTPVETAAPATASAMPEEREASPDVAALYAGAAQLATEVPEVQPAPAAEDSVAGAEDPQPRAENSVDIAALAAAAEQALEDVRLAEHPAPFLAELSQQRKDAVPTLMYLQHDYRAEGGSSVTINGQQASAGQSVGRGVRVDEVLPDSVVLSHEGEQFRLRALNSWVNL
ncbi:general secretion pathway protein GspB [Haliea sp.]|uniref:general secretion pathway protein GspB n=1 Tax=Haliea sp. TaxID=1932666 RepID=UPI0035282B5C